MIADAKGGSSSGKSRPLTSPTNIADMTPSVKRQAAVSKTKQAPGQENDDANKLSSSRRSSRSAKRGDEETKSTKDRKGRGRTRDRDGDSERSRSSKRRADARKTTP